MRDTEVLSKGSIVSSEKYAAHISVKPPTDLFLNIYDLTISDSSTYTCNLGIKWDQTN